MSSNAVWTALAATVASPFLALGDSVAMAYMDGWFAARFDPTLCRVRLHPMPDMMGRKLDRMLPCGHLYHTAIKALGRKRVRERRSATQASIADGAKHLAALYEVEPFTGYETLFPPYPERIFQLLVRVGLYDELFNIPQCNPARVERLLLGLFELVASPTVDAICRWRLHDAIAFWHLLRSFAPCSGASIFVKKSQLSSLLSQRVGPSACNALLEAFVVSNPNHNYRVPSDATHADSRECAIVEASSARYWIAPQPFLGPAFVARLISRYAKIDKHASSKIGVAFEEQMLRRMTELGIACRRADVGTKRAKAGDIDVIVETNEFVCLFELKKKGLTRRANAGNDAHLAIDLARGVVHGVNQLMRHELALLRDGCLPLRDGSVLSLKNRRVIKCVISLADYGGFHDGSILRNMLTSFRQVALSPKDSVGNKLTRGLEEANHELKILQMQCAEFDRLRRSDESGPFDNLLFHNVFYLEHALLSAPTAESLLQELIGRYRVSTGSRDPIFDHELFHQRA